MGILERLCFGERWGEVVSVFPENISTEQDKDTERVEINRFTLRPLTSDEYVVFTLDLCHNQIDRHFRWNDMTCEVLSPAVLFFILQFIGRGMYFRSVLRCMC